VSEQVFQTFPTPLKPQSSLKGSIMPKATQTPAPVPSKETPKKPVKKTTLADKRKDAAKVPGAKPASRKKVTKK